VGDVGLGKAPSMEQRQLGLKFGETVQNQLKRTEGSLLRRNSKPSFRRHSGRWKNDFEIQANGWFG
jgi:hypothetical protein